MKPIEALTAINRDIPCTCDLSIYIPCLNEEGNVGRTMESMIAVCDELKIDFELCVVDDGSRDGTLKEAQGIQEKYSNKKIRIFSNPERRGLARNFVDVAYVANGKYYMTVSGDNAEPMESSRLILSKMGQSDLIIAVFKNKDRRTASRKYLSRAFTKLVNILSGNNIDYYNGPTIHRRANVMRWHADTDCFAYQAEIITRLIEEGATYQQVVIANQDRIRGTSKAINFKNFLGIAHSLLQIALRRVRFHLFYKGGLK